jgi:serine/threonine protein kinase
LCPEIFCAIALSQQATIHQSVPVHSNIVTLHRTLETSSFLLLLLEYVPGQDLFYFLEQARDHYDVDLAADPALTHTPPTPGLLSSLHPSQLLSHTRLRLIASMFAQMCEAVATCHDASVFHRDIKPENFIVTDGWSFNQDGIRERKVAVKLSDFGLSTRDAVSSDMDCGSAPYMSYGSLSSFIPLPTLSLRSPSQSAETTWLLCISPVPQMYGPWASF